MPGGLGLLPFGVTQFRCD